MKRTIVIVCWACLVIPAPSFGDLIFGVMNATGTAQVSLGNIAFVNSQLTINSPASAQQGDFMALAGTTASIEDITNPPDATGVLGTPETDFLVFNAAPNISVTFTELPAGIDGAGGCTDSPPAAGQLCTPDFPDESPFNLENTSATSSTASFQIKGIEVDSLTGDTVPIIGTFTEPFTTMSFQDVLLAVENHQTVTTAFSAQFATSAPEPGTWGLLLLAALPAALLFRKSRRRA